VSFDFSSSLPVAINSLFDVGGSSDLTNSCLNSFFTLIGPFDEIPDPLNFGSDINYTGFWFEFDIYLFIPIAAG
jgi:hypothetical protein